MKEIAVKREKTLHVGVDYQAARALVNSKSDNSIKRFYKRLVKRGIEKNKALIATARKLVKVMFTILLERRKFVEFVDTKCKLCAGG